MHIRSLALALVGALLSLPLASSQSTTQSQSQSIALTTLVTAVPISPSPTSSSQATNTTLVLTVSPSPTASAGVTATNGTDIAPPSLNPIGVDPTYGILGALLLLLSLPLTLLGPKLRLFTPLLLCSLSLSIPCLLLILQFGVLPTISLHPPTSTLRGLFLLSCLVAAAVGAGLAALWREWGEWLGAAVGGFLIACWLQAWRTGGLVQGDWRWALFALLAVVGFVLCTVRKLRVAVLVGVSAVVGATGIMLGIDCFTAVGLKELYILNLGFTGLFPQLLPSSLPYPLTQPLSVELALIAVLVLLSIAIQLRLVPWWKLSQERKAEERAREEREKEEEEARKGLEEEWLRREREEWESRHAQGGASGSGTPRGSMMWDEKDAYPPSFKDPRPSSQFSLLPSVAYTPLPNPAYITRPYAPSRTHTLSNAQPAHADYFPAPAAAPVERRRTQSLGPLPTLDLGATTATPDAALGSLGIPGISTSISTSPEPSLPSSPKSTSARSPPASTSGSVDGRGTTSPTATETLQEIAAKQQLLNEIRTIRASIAALQTTPEPARSDPPSSGGSRSTSISAPAPPAIPNANASTAPSDWDAYLRSRRVVTPSLPSQPSQIQMQTQSPIQGPLPTRVRQSSAVRGALEGRRRRESMLELGEPSLSPPKMGGMGTGTGMGVGGGRERRGSAYTIAGPWTGPMQSASRFVGQEANANEMGALGTGADSRERRASAYSNSVPMLSRERRASNYSMQPSHQPAAQPTQAAPPMAPRQLTQPQLDARHRSAMRALQAPVSANLQQQAAERGRRKSMGAVLEGRGGSAVAMGMGGMGAGEKVREWRGRGGDGEGEVEFPRESGRREGRRRDVN